MVGLTTIEEADFLNAFLTPSKKMYIDRGGIESLLYDIKNGEKISGRAIHIGDGYFVTALHVIEKAGLQLVPQFTPTLNQGFGKFEVVTYDADNDVALLKIHTHEKSGTPLIRLADRLPQLGETASEFVRYYGNKVGADYVFQFEHKHVPKLGRIIQQANSPFLEKQGEVEYNSDNPRYPKFARTFGAQIPSLKGDSGSPVFLKVDNDKYALVGIASHVYENMPQILPPNHPFFNKDGYYTGAIVVDRQPIERLILQHITNSNQTPHPPSQ